MHPNPHKFLTFLFSLLPGAGHMYLGLMKRGLSFMALFAACILGMAVFSGFFMAPFAYVFALSIPVVWFVAFFDLWRYPRMTPEEKAAQQDEYLFIHGKQTIPMRPMLRKLRVVAGVLLVLAGLQTIYMQFLHQFVEAFVSSEYLQSFLWNLSPVIGAVAVIVVGLLLIFIKTRQPKQETPS